MRLNGSLSDQLIKDPPDFRMECALRLRCHPIRIKAVLRVMAGNELVDGRAPWLSRHGAFPLFDEQGASLELADGVIRSILAVDAKASVDWTQSVAQRRCPQPVPRNNGQ